VWHELGEHRGEMRVEGLVESLEHVTSKGLGQDVERYRLTADTGVSGLRCLRRYRACSSACRGDGLCRMRDLWGPGRNAHSAPRATRKLYRYLRLATGRGGPGLDLLHSHYRS
jgi:hypothetical protein